MFEKRFKEISSQLEYKFEDFIKKNNSERSAIKKSIEEILTKVDRLNEASEINSLGLEKLKEKIIEYQENIRDCEIQLKDIHEREEWTRRRFEEHDKEISNLIENYDSQLKDIHEREEWTRGRFEEHDKKIESMVLKQTSNAIQDNFYVKKTYSQSGEDAIISYVLNFLNIDLKNVKYLDLGANHAIEMSNTYAYYENGASGVLVEANPYLIDELKQLRPRDIILNNAICLGDEDVIDFYILSGDGLSTIDKKEAESAVEKNPELNIVEICKIKTITVNQIIEKYFSDQIDILSIDLEGIEEEILGQIDFTKYRPKVVILENIPYSPCLVIEKKENKGITLLKNNYIEYAFTGINSIFVDRTIVEEFNRRKTVEVEEEI